MRIRGDALKELAQARGVSTEQLGVAIERTGLVGDGAVRAVRNWMSGRHSPLCKAEDIRKLAAAVGVQTKDIARFTSQVRHHRGSPRKAKLLVDLIRGHGIIEAENMLRFTPKRAAVNVLKCLNAAVEDAKQSAADESLLVISHSTVDEGPRMKRFQPKDRGRAHSIIKRFSHITIGVEERAGKKSAPKAPTASASKPGAPKAKKSDGSDTGAAPKKASSKRAPKKENA